jgi:hypothetical protein
MEPDERCGTLCGITHDEHKRLLLFILNAVGDYPKLASPRWQFRFGDAMHELFAAPAMSDQLFDGRDLQVVPVGDLQQERTTGTFPRFIEYFAKHACRLQSGHPGKIHSRFRVSGAAKHSSLFGDQRVDMSGSDEVIWTAAGANQLPYCTATLAGGNSCFHGPVVNGHGVSGAQGIGTRGNHGWELKPIGDFGQHRHAKQPFAVCDHKVDQLRRCLFSGTDEITFILTILVIEYDHEVAAAHRIDNGIDCRELPCHPCPQMVIVFRQLYPPELSDHVVDCPTTYSCRLIKSYRLITDN